MMETYTKEQLIKAQQKYNQNVVDEPEHFYKYDPKAMLTEKTAIAQIEYLLSLVE